MEFWQAFTAATGDDGPFTDRYPAPMPDGSHLVLPLRVEVAWCDATQTWWDSQDGRGDQPDPKGAGRSRIAVAGARTGRGALVEDAAHHVRYQVGGVLACDRDGRRRLPSP